MKTKDFERLSESAKSIIQSWGGFRDDQFYGEGYTDLKEVMDHETMELENTDIYDTMVNVYGVKLPYYKIFDKNDEDYGKNECAANNAVILKFFQDLFGTETVHCKWLCAEASDIRSALLIKDENYDESVIEHFVISGQCAVVSDMGKDGVLIGSDVPIISEREMDSEKAVAPKKAAKLECERKGQHSSELLLSALKSCDGNITVLDPKNDLKNAGL